MDTDAPVIPEPESSSRSARRRLFNLGLVGLVTIALGTLYVVRASQPGDVNTYFMSYEALPGWTVMPHAPLLVFQLHDETSGLDILGADQRTESDINPSPDVDTAKFADNLVSITRTGLTGWTAERIGSVKTAHAEFELVRRGTTDRQILCACCVKGNSTVMISLVGLGPSMSKVDDNTAAFKEFLKSVRLSPAAIAK